MYIIGLSIAPVPAAAGPIQGVALDWLAIRQPNGHAGAMPPKTKATSPADPFSSTEKLMQTFRMPRELVAFLRREADHAGRDLTAFVNRHLDGLRTWFGLPEAASRLLEADREALKMGRYEYLLHLLFQRSLELRDKGPGFDAPGATERKKR
jgi:hypothetical protein